MNIEISLPSNELLGYFQMSLQDTKISHIACDRSALCINKCQNKKRKRLEKKSQKMTISRNYKETINERIQAEPDFASAVLDEALTLLLNGETDTAKLILRDMVNNTIGFETLAQLTNKPGKSLHRMLSNKGNPTINNLTAILKALRQKFNIDFEVRAVQCQS